MKKILLIALMLSVITACTKTEEFCEADRQFHLRFGKSKNTPFHLEEMVDTFYSVQLEDSFIVGNVDEIRYINDKFYLICKKEGRITCVDRNGRFLHTLKKKGHAKSEYVMMSDADISPDGSYHIYDGAQRKLLRYTPTGQFRDAIIVEDVPNDIAVLPNGDYLFYTPICNPANYNDGLWQTDSNGVFKKQLFELEEGYSYGGVHPTYFNKISDSCISVMGPESNDNVYMVTPDSQVTAYHLNFGMKIPNRLKYEPTVEYEKHKGKIYIKHMYMESSRWMLIQATDFESPIIFIYDKKNDKEYHITGGGDIIDTYSLSSNMFFLPNDLLASILYPDQILQYKVYRERYPNITMHSNPVLQIAKLTK